MPPTDDLPRLRARTGGFRRGQPRSAATFGGPEDWRVRYLASSGPFDPVLALRELDSDGRVSVLANPADLLADDEDLPPAERARRERLRESGAGITAFSSDRTGERSAFVLSGRLWVVDRVPRAYDVTGAVDPQLSPDGSRVACHANGDLVVVDLESGSSTVLARGGPDVTVGLADFIAAEEMGRMHGLWWSPDSDRLLFTQVDESPVGTWWLSDPARPESAPRAVRYPAAGTPNADVRLFRTDLAGMHTEVRWDRQRFPYLAAVRWAGAGALVSVQSRDQRTVVHLLVESDCGTRELGRQVHEPWVELVPGSPRLDPDGRLVVVAADPVADAWRVRVGDDWVTPPELYVRSVLRCDDSGLWLTGSADPRENHLYRLANGTLEQLTADGGWHSTLASGPVPVVAMAREDAWQPELVVGDPRQPSASLPDAAALPAGQPRPIFLPPEGAVRVVVLLPPGPEPAPVIVSSYGGPHAQRVVRAPLSLATEQWFADNGFAVVVIDGRGTPGVSPECEESVAGDLAGPVLEDQIAGLRAAQRAFPQRLDLERVGIRGWSFGGYLAALAVLRAPEVFHAAFAGAPVTDWRLYDTHYTERYLADPAREPENYERSSLIPLAPGLVRPLCLVHGLADDNVVSAHTLQLSAALTAHGRPHQVLPLPGVSHMTPQEAISENLLRLELAFFARELALPAG